MEVSTICSISNIKNISIIKSVMAPTNRPSDYLLARVNFPLYTVEMISSRFCLVAGGGGSSKTGVANGFVSRNFVTANQLALNLVNVRLHEQILRFIQVNSHRNEVTTILIFHPRYKSLIIYTNKKPQIFFYF